jgi:predicted DNA-binding protein
VAQSSKHLCEVKSVTLKKPRKTAVINIRLAPEDVQRVKDQAKRSGRSVSAHVWVLIQAAEVIEMRIGKLNTDAVAKDIAQLVQSELSARLNTLRGLKSDGTQLKTPRKDHG